MKLYRMSNGFDPGVREFLKGLADIQPIPPLAIMVGRSSVVERGTHNPKVEGSIPSVPTKHSNGCSNWNVLDPDGQYKGAKECGCRG